VNSRHPEPRRVLGRCRAAVRGPDPGDPRMGSFFRVLGIKTMKMNVDHHPLPLPPPAEIGVTGIFNKEIQLGGPSPSHGLGEGAPNYIP